MGSRLPFRGYFRSWTIKIGESCQPKHNMGLIYLCVPKDWKELKQFNEHFLSLQSLICVSLILNSTSLHFSLNTQHCSFSTLHFPLIIPNPPTISKEYFLWNSSAYLSWNNKKTIL